MPRRGASATIDGMKAIVQERYGAPEVLEFREIATPVPGDDELLVRVHATSVNAWDWHMMRGDPYVSRLSAGLRRPKNPVRGRDFAGVVELIGRDVTGFAEGDEVFGDLGAADGAFAEYVRVSVSAVEHKPAGLSFEQAAAMPLAGNTALRAMRDVQPGQSVLINGASGGVGTFAVQLGKAFGAEVTAVCSTRNAELVRSLGADRIVDYRNEDFATTGERYDLVLDLVGNRSLADLRRVARGTVMLSGGGTSDGSSLFGPVGLIVRGTLAARLARAPVTVLSTAANRPVLTALKELAEAGKVTPVIDRVYPLADAAAAIRYVEREHARAKVVITA
jgi:NADPH:quinone reductase-like Zn-dependent oxidoreductase